MNKKMQQQQQQQHKENLKKNIQKRLQVARDKRNFALIMLLEKELAYLGLTEV